MGVICFLLLLTYFKICRCISIIGSLQKCSVFRALKVQSAGIIKKICWCFLQKLCLAVYLLRFCQIKLSINKTGITCISCIIYYWNPVFCYHWLSSVKVQAKFAFVHSKRAECTSFLYAYLLRLRQTKQIWIKMY